MSESPSDLSAAFVVWAGQHDATGTTALTGFDIDIDVLDRVLTVKAELLEAPDPLSWDVETIDTVMTDVLPYVVDPGTDRQRALRTVLSFVVFLADTGRMTDPDAPRDFAEELLTDDSLHNLAKAIRDPAQASLRVRLLEAYATDPRGFSSRSKFYDWFFDLDWQQRDQVAGPLPAPPLPAAGDEARRDLAVRRPRRLLPTVLAERAAQAPYMAGLLGWAHWIVDKRNEADPALPDLLGGWCQLSEDDPEQRVPIAEMLRVAELLQYFLTSRAGTFRGPRARVWDSGSPDKRASAWVDVLVQVLRELVWIYPTGG